MNYVALTGIAQAVINELKLGKTRTLELQSTHNVITLAEIEPGNPVFMTSVDVEDLTPGDEGIIVDVLSISIMMKRLVEYSSGYHFEERERVSARVRVRCIGSTRVKSVKYEGVFQPTIVDVVKSVCYHAG